MATMRREIGGLLIAVGFFLILLSLIQTFIQGNARFGGVLLIGPIPIVFGSSPELALASMVMALALMVLYFLLFRGKI